MRQGITRRRLLATSSGAASGLFLGACMAVEEIIDEIPTPGFRLPTLEDLALGEAHLVWQPGGGLYRIYPEEGVVALLNANLDEVWRYGGLGEAVDQLNLPTNLVTSPDGTIFVIDRGNDRVVRLDPDGQRMSILGGPGTDEGQLSAARGGTWSADEGVLWVADAGNHRIQAFAPSGESAGVIGQLGEDEESLNFPRSVAIDPQGDLHVVDTGNARIQVYSPSGAFRRSYGAWGTDDGQYFSPRSIAIDGLGTTFVSDPSAGILQVHGPDGAALVRFQSLELEGEADDSVITPLDVGLTDAGALYLRVGVARS